MASRPPPSFFIVFLHPSHSQLPLPSSFVSKHLGNQVPKDPIIQTSNGGYIWRLKIKKIGENYWFTNGWSNIVKEVQLGFGDLLLFRLIDKSTFKLLIYSPSGCQKYVPPKIKVEEDVDSVSSVDDSVCSVDDCVCNDDDDEDDDVDDDVGDEEEEDFEDEKEEADESDDDDVCDVDEDEDVDDDGVHIDGDDGDPFFYSTISKAHKSTLRLPTGFVGLAEIDADKTVIVKNLDGQEWPIQLLSEQVNESERYYLSAGWAEFRRNNDLLEGDECVFKFITSEDKLCLAKITKKKRPTRQSQPSSEIQATEHGGNVDVEVDSDDDINGDDDNDDEDDDADHIDGEDDDPSFTATMSKSHKHILRLPSEFVEFAGIEAGKTIMMKDPENKEWPMGLRKQKKKNKQPERFYIFTGWSDFYRSNGLSEGDECVFQFNRSEGKLCLAKVTNIKRQSQQPSEKILASKDDEHDADDDGEHDDGDPFFTTIISKSPAMRLPEEFVHLPGIEDGKMITVKNLDGEELQVGLRLEKRYKRSYYLLSAGWRHFMESNKLMNGDECVFKFIRSEVKLCLAKVTNKKSPPIRVDGVDVENEDNGSSGEDDDIDCEEDGGGGGDIDDDHGDPFVTFTVPKGHSWRFPQEFMGLPGIGHGKSIMVKNLDGSEQPWRLLLEKSYTKTIWYTVSAGWIPFIRSNSLSAGDICVLKFIGSEGKLCLTKVTNNKKPELKRQSAKVVTRMRRQRHTNTGQSPAAQEQVVHTTAAQEQIRPKRLVQKPARFRS